MGKTIHDFRQEDLEVMTDAQVALLAPIETKFQQKVIRGEPMLLPTKLQAAHKSIQKFHQECLNRMRGPDQTTINMSFGDEHFFHGACDNNIDIEDIFLFLNLRVFDASVLRCFVL